MEVQKMTKLRRTSKGNNPQITVKMPQEVEELCNKNNIHWCKVSVNGKEIKIILCDI